MAKKQSRKAKLVAPDAVGVAEATSAVKAHFMANYHARVRLFDFLDASYKGGISYKEQSDAHGNPVLIEHENELPFGKDSQGIFQNALASTGGGESKKVNRHARRKRIAAYENHVKPIVDKVSAYVVRNKPKRHTKTEGAVTRLHLDEWIEDMVCEGLKFTEWWIGWDTANIGTDKPLTKADVEAVDPVNKGQPYLVSMDPRRVVDYETDPDDPEVITRVVFEEILDIKGSLTAKPSRQVSYKEWTATQWTVYRVKDASKTGDASGIEVTVDEPVQHDFGMCPWVRFAPPFPIEDIAELNRALFNMNSLLDEELYQCTFTQKWIVGEKPENLAGLEGGTGNTLVIPEPGAQVGAFGAVAGQSQALMDRVNHLREAIYMIVSMENTNTKNVAETAEKKQRDLESLYTMLVKIVKAVEQAENMILSGMGIIDTDNAEELTTYDRKFDVNSIAELQAEIATLCKVPFAPPSLKRSLTKQLAAKLDPFGDQDDYDSEVDLVIDASPDFVAGIEALAAGKLATPDMLADLLGVPDNARAKFIAMIEGHMADVSQANAAPDDDTEDDGESDFGDDEPDESTVPIEATPEGATNGLG